MNGLIQKHSNSYYPMLTSPPPVVRTKRTCAYISNALDTLKAYHDYRQITEEEYLSIKKQIKASKNDDVVSGIMCRLRKRVYG